ncbi:pyrroline-5-carboxylate reductase [Bacillaceae bacterium SIJ1]|uniref:pyrroline-5-carboxylate reductase n=1 Tax=Litoribacterium kuwaitense TaxID=1398745 RepID=UPI0013E9F49A|nr:pyrroline-5-carboxylate reductase [Litoribacterium kuwaitense]NGP44416.1 pyrroline-5-carboxylate reductase [Litoribacterium kuwaitense]
MKNEQIVFLGAGSMAEAIVRGMLSQEIVEQNQITITNKTNVDRLEFYKKTYGVLTSQTPKEIIPDASLLIFAMKPKEAEAAFLHVKDELRQHQLILSVIAGLPISTMQSWTSPQAKAIRVMPNTSSAISLSTTAFCSSPNVSIAEKERIETILSSIGSVYEIKEEQMNLFTGLAGSSPAYMYQIMEYFEATAAAHGFTREQGRQWIVEIMAGAAEMVKATSLTPEQLRKQVTSPKGTTYEGLLRLKEGHAEDSFRQAIESSAKKSAGFEQQFLKRMNEKN